LSREPREAELDQIFEEFRQGGQFATREHGGTGLGLAISRKLISLMEGRLSVRSVPGEGSVFWLELPAGDRTRSPARPEKGASPTLGARAPARNPSHSHPPPPRR
jgi:K+-sensing histidine kinase KdpD